MCWLSFPANAENTHLCVPANAAPRIAVEVARWGGEEFLVIAESVTRDESAIIAESLRSLVELGTQEVLSTTISIGVVHSNVGRGTEQMLKRADEALYAAKNSGRNRAITL